MLQTQRHRSHEAKSFVASWNWSCKSLREPLDSLHSLKPGTKMSRCLHLPVCKHRKTACLHSAASLLHRDRQV